MGSDGTHGPKPYQQHQASTLFLRVAAVDWSAVKRGYKREFRGLAGSQSGLLWVEPPIPVVAYAVRPSTGHEAQLMVLEATWQEPLGAITPESLAAEGQPDLAHFRRYWMQRTRRRFRPNAIVNCYRVRPFEPEDRAVMADLLLERLYGAFLDTP